MLGISLVLREEVICVCARFSHLGKDGRDWRYDSMV